jgi:hypothetical protein
LRNSLSNSAAKAVLKQASNRSAEALHRPKSNAKETNDSELTANG